MTDSIRPAGSFSSMRFVTRNNVCPHNASILYFSTSASNPAPRVCRPPASRTLYDFPLLVNFNTCTPQAWHLTSGPQTWPSISTASDSRRQRKSTFHRRVWWKNAFRSGNGWPLARLRQYQKNMSSSSLLAIACILYHKLRQW